MLINEEKGIKLPLISLIKKTSVCLEKDHSKIAILLMIRLLSDKDDEVRAAVVIYLDKVISPLESQEKLFIIDQILPLIEDNDLKIKQSAF